MRLRISILATLLLMLALSACSGSPLGRAATPTPRPVKTLRPTFTPAAKQGVTIAATSTRRPTMTPTATVPATSTVPPTATSEPTPTPKPAQARLTVVNATLNVRGGPGTSYPVVGQVRQGQEFPITGKNSDGSWWQFDFEGQPGWVLGTMVTVNEAAAAVEVAANIPEAPTAAPRPTSAPRPPTQPPAPPTQFQANGLDPRAPNQNSVVTVYCRVWNNKKNGLIAGTMRVSGPAGTKEVTFLNIKSNLYYPDTFYNTDCKVEFPLVEGSYTAVLLGGGQPISDPITFQVAGENREFVPVWQQR